MESHQILVTGVFESIDVLIRFWSRQVKGQGHSRKKTKTLWTLYLRNQWSKFHPILVTYIFGP